MRVTEDTESEITLFIEEKEERCLLTSEARSAAVLDSGSSSTVSGTQWMQCYLDSLPSDKLSQIRKYEGRKVFKFGGKETKKSVEIVEIPCLIAGKTVTIRTDAVDSDIPLLLSKDDMKKAKVTLDLENDKAITRSRQQSLKMLCLCGLDQV